MMEEQVDKVEELLLELKKHSRSNDRSHAKSLRDEVKISIEALKSQDISESMVAYLDGFLKYIDNDPGAEEMLATAIKKNPKNARAWKILGELFYSQGDYDMACESLMSGSEYTQDKGILRNLSMALRKRGSNPLERRTNMFESLVVAKQAVALDFEDSDSWYVLGNTYLNIFFAISHSTKDLESSLKAYGKSEEIEIRNAADTSKMKRNGDLYFNRGQVFAYLQNFEAAVKDYQTAAEIDETLEAQTAISVVEKRLRLFDDLCRSSGHIKPKVLTVLANKCMVGHGLDILQLGENADKKISVQFIQRISCETPISFLVLDHNSRCAIVSVYSIDSTGIDKLLSERGSCAIHSPILKHISLDGCEIDLLELDNPGQIHINGKSLAESFAHAAMASTNL